MSAVSYQLRQLTSIHDGPLYRVKNEVLSAVASTTAVFVYKVDTQAFSHYATVVDLENWPDSYEEALQESKSFYRQSMVQRDWAAIGDMNKDLGATIARLQSLATELSTIQGNLTIDRVVTIGAGG